MTVTATMQRSSSHVYRYTTERRTGRIITYQGYCSIRRHPRHSIALLYGSFQSNYTHLWMLWDYVYQCMLCDDVFWMADAYELTDQLTPQVHKDDMPFHDGTTGSLTSTHLHDIDPSTHQSLKPPARPITFPGSTAPLIASNLGKCAPYKSTTGVSKIA